MQGRKKQATSYLSNTENMCVFSSLATYNGCFLSLATYVKLSQMCLLLQVWSTQDVLKSVSLIPALDRIILTIFHGAWSYSSHSHTRLSRTGTVLLCIVIYIEKEPGGPMQVLGLVALRTLHTYNKMMVSPH